MLAGFLIVGLVRQRGAGQSHLPPSNSLNLADRKLENIKEPGTGANPQTGQEQVSKTPPGVDTAFAQIYSSDPKSFVANLRAIHCPELTIHDILTAEVHRRFQAQEQALRPTPADHVPWSWSARTTEPRLLERREQAAALAREEGSLLRTTLGCEATVPMPLYAKTSSDEQFEESLAGPAAVNACSMRAVQDTYWSDVQALQQRTKGFWLPEDVAELERLKAQRRQLLANFLPGN